MKKKSRAAPVPASSRPARPSPVLALRGSPSWRAWLAGLAGHERRPMSTVVEMALEDRARAVGYGPPMPPRAGGAGGRV